MEDGAAATSAAPAAEPRAGGRLRLPGGDPATLDPAMVGDVNSAEYLYEIYSGLVSVADDLAVIPDLAERWEVDPSGRVYTFTLRSDARFHDGRPVTAQDVVYSLQRACSPELASRVAATYLGDIVGCLDHQAGRAPDVSGVQAPDDQHVVLTIDAPKAYFLAKLTYPTAFVVDRRQVAAGAEDWQLQPNATGPFRLAEYQPEERLLLTRNPDYYRGPAYLDEVEFDLRPADAMSRYENRELDATPVGVSDLERVSDPLNPLSYELMQGPASLDVQYLAFNNRLPPFDDVHVRRALNLALDKERLARVVLQGGVVPAEGILPPGLPGYVAGPGPLHYDEAAARRELAASRYGGPEELPPLTLYGAGEGGSNPMLAAVSDYLQQTLGVTVTVEQAPYDTFQAELAAGRYGMYALGWAADYADPQDFLDLLFHSQSPLNQTGYANPTVDQLLEEARVAADGATRLALYTQAHRLILEDAPWVPLYHSSDRWLVAPEVQGFSVPPIVLPRLARVWLNPAGS